MALSRRAPKTYGELRKMLAELGNPWLPDPTLSDDEEYTRSGINWIPGPFIA